MSVAERWERMSRATWSADAPRDRSSNTGMSRRCNSVNAFCTLSTHSTDRFAAFSNRSVSARSDAGQPRYRTDFRSVRIADCGLRIGLAIGPNEVTVAVRIDLDARRAVGAVDEAAIRRAAMRRVEGDRREPVAVVRFPLVELAV